MYLIVNKTRKSINISDIKISLGPQQGIDLAKVRDIKEIEKSKDLKRAVAAGDIEIRGKKESSSPPPSQPQELKEIKYIPENNKSEINEELMNKFKEDIISEVKNIIKENKDKSSENNNITKEDLKDVLSDLLSNNNKEKKNSNDEEEVIDMDKLSQIGQKVVNKMVKDTVGSQLDLKEEKQTDSNINNNIKELESLLDN